MVLNIEADQSRFKTLSVGRRAFVAMGALLIGHATFLAYGAFCNSPTWDEVGHLPAGLSHLQLGRFDLYCVNPPLVRMVAAIPISVSGAKTVWEHYPTNAFSRDESTVGNDFIEANGDAFGWYFTIARWACIPFSLIGGLVCWTWGRKLYGSVAGFIALFLWCICPNVIGHGQLITPDVGATSLGVAAGYTYWRWLKAPTWQTTGIAGVVLGLAELAKSTWIILFLLWPALALFWQMSQPVSRPITGRSRVVRLAAMLLLAIYALNLGYGFEGSFTKLGDYRFISDTLRGNSPNAGHNVGNRFAGTWLGAIPVPLPKHYLHGIDIQKSDFDGKMWSYLRGQWKLGGWYHYYLYAMLVKIPLGTWLVGMLAIVISVLPQRWIGGPLKLNDRPPRELEELGVSWRDEVILLAPGLTVFVFVSCQTGFNHHLRYVLPVFPFVFIWISRVGRYFGSIKAGPIPQLVTVSGFHRVLVSIVCSALAWSAFSSLQAYPHSLSYFNELVGGPTHDYLSLGGSNVEWGQDLWYLQAWYNQHPEARPLHVAYYLPLDLNIVGIDCEPVPIGPVMNRAGTLYTTGWPWGELAETADSTPPQSEVRPQNTALGPLPGWFILSVNYIRRVEGDYEYFQEFEPVDKVGYSMNVYHITREDADRVRRKLGLPLLERELAGQGNSESSTEHQ